MPYAILKKSAWFRMLWPFAAVYLGIQLVTRIGLLIYSGQSGELHQPLQWLELFGWGLLFDLEAMGFILIPLVLAHLLVSPARWGRRPLHVTRVILFVLNVYAWLFGAIAEYFFWEEFGTRFNFIAVDYLVYTTEVIGNIRESYPLVPLLSAIAAGTAILTLLCWKKLALTEQPQKPLSTNSRWNAFAAGLGILAMPCLLFSFLSVDQIHLSSDQALQELATNGTYDLFSAYRNNELSYKKFYVTDEDAKIATNVRALLGKQGHRFVSDDPQDITRLIKRDTPEIHKNVVLVVMESMSADFMGVFGNPGNLTPNMDALSKQGLFLSDLYATGTRTVRGLEAVTLSVPPTPGQSIVRRPGNENLYSLGFVFQDRGYDTAFIYGGHGMFDNMNEFFSHNGFRIVDRMQFPDKDVTFSNVWGVADEDLYNQVIKQADAAYQAKKPFMYEVMTTSNHRPYTYPDGRIDIPSKTGGRSGGVKYADYAVGKFLADAGKKPWFKDTVFVFVADHTAGAGGKIELSLKKYHIPAIFYAPGFIKPQDYSHLASQIDIAPTLLGLLDFSYYSKFFGEDLLHEKYDAAGAHAFISNYQKAGLLQRGQLTVLEPMQKIEYFDGEEPMAEKRVDPALLFDAVTYYQYASSWRERMRRIPTVYQP